MSDHVTSKDQGQEFRMAAARSRTPLSATDISEHSISCFTKHVRIKLKVPRSCQHIVEMLTKLDTVSPYQPLPRRGLGLAVRMSDNSIRWDTMSVVRRLPSMIQEGSEWVEYAGNYVLKMFKQEEGEMVEAGTYLSELEIGHGWQALHLITTGDTLDSLEERMMTPNHPMNMLPTLTLTELDQEEAARMDSDIPDDARSEPALLDMEIEDLIISSGLLGPGMVPRFPHDILVGSIDSQRVQHSPPPVRQGQYTGVQHRGDKDDDEEIETSTPRRPTRVSSRNKKPPFWSEEYVMDFADIHEDWDGVEGRRVAPTPSVVDSVPVTRIIHPGYPSSQQSSSFSSAFSTFRGSREYPGKILQEFQQ